MTNDYVFGFKWDALPGRAAKFALDAHAQQLRKYTNDPYIHHPVAVAKIIQWGGHDEAMLAAALSSF